MLIINFKEQALIQKDFFYTQGDYGLWQCSVPCHQETYDNEEIVREMIEKQKDMKVTYGACSSLSSLSCSTYNEFTL